MQSLLDKKWVYIILFSTVISIIISICYFYNKKLQAEYTAKYVAECQNKSVEKTIGSFFKKMKEDVDYSKKNMNLVIIFQYVKLGLFRK